MTYQQAKACLDQLQLFKIKLGLETTAEILADLGHPQERLRIIHIAGTNGKGSVGATLSAVLTAGGYRTGFYSSPHLSTIRERFRLNNTLIPQESFTRLVSRLHASLEHREPTYFEFTTLLALLWFAEEQADIVILETGMGGRLDATNVVMPLLSIITDISRDHEQHLGNTLAAIAGEKAGIIKPGVPVVFSGREPEALPIIEDRCQNLQSPLYLYGRDFDGRRSANGTLDYHPLAGRPKINLPLLLAGSHQEVNSSLALAALELLSDRFPISDAQLRQGLSQVRWPGRLELIRSTGAGCNHLFLLDGAHNQAGVHALRRTLQHDYPRKQLLLLWANMADKQIDQAMLELLALVDQVVFTRADSQRSANPHDVLASLPKTQQIKAQAIDEPDQALDQIMAMAGPEDLICVAGSLYLVGLIRRRLLGETR